MCTSNHAVTRTISGQFWAFIIPPPNNEVVGGYTPRTTKLLGGILVSLRPSVRPSVRLSLLPCPLCNIYSSGWILSILTTNDHYRERVCRTQWPISSRSFGPDLEHCVRSVASTGLDVFFLYLIQMITIIRGCVACYIFCRIWKFEFLANFWNFSALTFKKKIYSSQWILSIFSTNDH